MQHTVLLVDDEPNVLAGLQRALRKEPYEILSAGSADEALTVLRARTVDVVVSDHDMPGTTGTAFLAKVHAEFPDTARFILTGKAALDVVQQAIKEGTVDQFLTKPCNREDLADSIRQTLQQKGLLRAAAGSPRTITGQSTEFEHLEQGTPGIMQARPDKEEEGSSTPEDSSFESYLYQLRHEIARPERGVPSLIRMQCNKGVINISTPEDISFEECLRQCATAQRVSLVHVRNGRIAQATPVSLDATYLIADTEYSTIFFKQGERLLVVFPILPQEYYVLQTWVDVIYIKRLKLRYSVSHEEVRR